MDDFEIDFGHADPMFISRATINYMFERIGLLKNIERHDDAQAITEEFFSGF